MLDQLKMRQQQTLIDRTNDLEMFVNVIGYVFMDTYMWWKIWRYVEMLW